MTQFAIENGSPYAFEPLFVADPEGRPVIVAICKATFDLTEGGNLVAAEQQEAPCWTGRKQDEDADDSSYIYEPETALIKLATDVVMVGHARAPRPGAQVVDVGLKVGPVQKIVRVFGDRYWAKTGGRVIATRPQAFERVPLVYERAFGGWDRGTGDEREWTFEPRNTVGRGFGDPLRYVEQGKVAMPNLEDPNHLIKRYGDRPPPAGFGFVSPHWQPRSQYAGTYDAEWDSRRKPLLPLDFDPRFFNAAPPGLIAPGHLKGDEGVVVVNASPVPQLRFELPGVAPPVCHIDLRGRKAQTLETRLDTVIVNTDEMRVLLLWRAYATLPGGPQDIAAVRVMAERRVREPTVA